MNLKSILGAVFISAVAANPALAGPFPLCLYGVNNPSDVAIVKQAGFNCFQSYQKDPEKLAALARAAKKQGMQVVFYPDEIIGSSYEKKAQNWPVLAWYLVDEPDVARWSRKRVTDKINQTRQVFTHHANALVIGQGKTKITYYDLPDNLMVDWYPVPHLPLTSFGDNVRWAKEGQQGHDAGENPLWGVVQIFDWKEYKQHRADHERIGRFPTQEEIRFMSYDGILNGATGLFYFIFTSNGHPLPTVQPEWWERVKAVSGELSKLRPILEKGREIAPRVKIVAPLAAKTWAYKGYEYTLLLNRSAGPVEVPPVFLNKPYILWDGSSKTTQMPAYGVWILKKRQGKICTMQN